MKLEYDHKCLIIPSDWVEEATEGIARLNKSQSCYFLLPWEQPSQPKHYPKAIEFATQELNGQAALFILPKSFAKAEYVLFWPKLIQSGFHDDWICGLVFADQWEEVESYLLGFSSKLYCESIDVNVSCQYQPPYTDMLGLWGKAGAKSYHPGDYFKEDFLLEFQKMTGIWAYWGHAEGDRLRGYSHLMIDELLSNGPAKPFHLTLWFACSTLDPEVEENIGLSWFLSGKTQSLLASPYKVKTEENQLLGKEFLETFTQKNHLMLSEIIFSLQAKKDQSISGALNQYYLLGSPWIEMKISILSAK